MVRCESLSFEFLLELLSKTPVCLESSVLCLLIQSWVPVIEFVETVAEAEALLHCQVANIFFRVALDEALLVQVLAQSIVFLHHCCKIVLCAKFRCLKFLNKTIGES